MAGEDGFEPPTSRLFTAGRSNAELLAQIKVALPMGFEPILGFLENLVLTVERRKRRCEDRFFVSVIVSPFLKTYVKMFFITMITITHVSKMAN